MELRDAVKPFGARDGVLTLDEEALTRRSPRVGDGVGKGASTNMWAQWGRRRL